MKILIHTIFYRPDLVGIAKYTTEMCEWLAARGHSVEVVSPPPYYPRWRIEPPYRSWQYKNESLGEVHVTRCPIWIPTRPGGLQRILYALSFALSSVPALAAKIFRPPQAVLVLEPSLLNAIPALVVAKLTGALAWLHIHDFEIDLAFGLGQLRQPAVRALLHRVESWLMRQFDIVSSISKPMLAKTRGRGVDAAKLVLFPNWVDTDAIFPMDVPSPLRAELGIPSDAIVGLFSGTLGAKQGVDVLIQAAKKVSHDRVLFLICGDGPAASKLKTMAAELSNVRFIPLQPSRRLNEVLNTADFHLLPQVEAVADSVLPSKLLGMLASGRAVIATVGPNSEVGRMVGDGGVLVPPGDSARLVEAIRALASDTERRARLGAEARHRAVETLQQERILADFERELLARLNREPASAVAESGALK